MRGARERGTGVYTAVHEDPERESNEADRSRSSFAGCRHVFWMTIEGNFAEKSSAFCATNTAVRRAISR
jgi:hypothetical protein